MRRVVSGEEPSEDRAQAAAIDAMVEVSRSARTDLHPADNNARMLGDVLEVALEASVAMANKPVEHLLQFVREIVMANLNCQHPLPVLDSAEKFLEHLTRDPSRDFVGPR